MIKLTQIKDITLLEKIDVVEKLLDEIASKCNFNVVAKSGHQFEPFGVTFVHVLAESHMSIHTYPENAAAYMDIFCCSPDFNPESAINIIRTIFDCEVDNQTFIR